MDRRGDIIRFGSDGWRARYEDGFDAEGVARVADGLGLVWSDAASGTVVYVGFDTRHESRELARLAAGILSSYGLVVRVSDVACPTATVGWSCARDEQACGAIMLTASELSCEYGGLLVRGADGGRSQGAFSMRSNRQFRLPLRSRAARSRSATSLGPT